MNIHIGSADKGKEGRGYYIIYCKSYDYEYRRRNDIIRANRPVASDRAKPRILYVKRAFRREGFRDEPWIRAANTIPTPIPAPVRPSVAIPDPIYLAAASMIVMCRKILCNIVSQYIRIIFW